MAKRMISFRIDENRLMELDSLASVYTNGNCTLLLEALISFVFCSDNLARHKFRNWIHRFYSSSSRKQSLPNDKRVVYTVNGEVQSFRVSEISDLAYILKLPIDTNDVYTISVKRTPK